MYAQMNSASTRPLFFKKKSQRLQTKGNLISNPVAAQRTLKGALPMSAFYASLFMRAGGLYILTFST